MPEHPSEPLKTHLLRALYRLSGRKPSVDAFLSRQLKYRKCLREVDAHEVIPDFQTTEVRIGRCPIGVWSTPMGDVVVLLKAVLGFGSKRILEIGSYRGDTARLLAENTAVDARICTVDIDPRHGSSYRGTPLEKKIDRRTGAVSSALFAGVEKFDLIFVDANHDFDSVMNDTEVAFKHLAKQGVILWHDYVPEESYFHGLCGVPEALKEYSKQHSICAIRGTRLAIYSSVKGWETAVIKSGAQSEKDGTVWEQTQVRG